MIARDEDGNWYAVIAIGTAIPCRTKGEAEKVSRTLSQGMFIGAVVACVVLLIGSGLFYFVVTRL